VFFASQRAALRKLLLQRSYLIGSACGVLLSIVAASVLVNKVAAHNQDRELYAVVIIDGVDYGRLGNFAELDLPSHRRCTSQLEGPCDKSESAINLHLEHSFIAENSLFQWAKDASRNPNNSQARDVSILLCNRYGEEVDRYTLAATKPGAWSIEVAESSQGGFRENIQVFAQKIVHGPL
jgi:hypothetical protein